MENSSERSSKPVILPNEVTPRVNRRASLQIFMQPRNISEKALLLTKKEINSLDLSPEKKRKIVDDRNFACAAIRKVVEDMSLTSVQGNNFKHFVSEVGNLLPNIPTEDKGIWNALKVIAGRNMIYKKKRSRSPGKEESSARKKLNLFPTEYLPEDGPVEVLLKIGNEVCLLDNGFPVGKGKVRSYPCIDNALDVDEESRKEWVGIQITLKRRGSKVDSLPSTTEHRSWENVGYLKETDYIRRINARKAKKQSKADSGSDEKTHNNEDGGAVQTGSDEKTHNNDDGGAIQTGSDEKTHNNDDGGAIQTGSDEKTHNIEDGGAVQTGSDEKTHNNDDGGAVQTGSDEKTHNNENGGAVQTGSDEKTRNNEDGGAIQTGNEVCLLDDGFPVGKGKVRSYPCIDKDLDVDEESRKEWVGIQITLKRRGSKVDSLPSMTEHRSWENVGKGSKVAWKLMDIKPAPFYEQYLKDTDYIRRINARKAKKQSQADSGSDEKTHNNEDGGAIQTGSDEKTHNNDDGGAVQTGLDEKTHNNEDGGAVQTGSDMDGGAVQQGLKIHDYVEVRFTTVRGKEKRFFGMVTSLGEEIEVSFLKDTTKTDVKVWPRIPDVSVVNRNDIIKKLDTPRLDARERLCFHY